MSGSWKENACGQGLKTGSFGVQDLRVWASFHYIRVLSGASFLEARHVVRVLEHA